MYNNTKLITLSNKNFPQCICVNSKKESPLLHYGRFTVSPLLSGQANLLGTVLRKILLGEIQGTCITSVSFNDTVHEYSTLEGIRESVHEILLNLRDVVLTGHTQELTKGFLSFQGPGVVTAEHIRLPSNIKVVDKTQHIARIEQAVDLNLELFIKEGKGLQKHLNIKTASSTFLIDAKFTPITNVNFNIYFLGEKSVPQELLILDIWTNGALTPEEALLNASNNLIWLLQPFFKITQNI